MNERIIISRGNSDILLVSTLKNDLMKRRFYTWNANHLLEDDKKWWKSFEEALGHCYVLLALVSLPFNPSTETQREIDLAHEYKIPIIPLVFEGDADNLSRNDFAFDPIDISSRDKYATGIEGLFEALYRAFGIHMESADPNVESELDQMILRIRGILWVRIMNTSGLSHPVYQFDHVRRKDKTEIEREEDMYGPMSTVVISLQERFLSELNLGNSRFTVLSGQNATHFLLPIGDGKEWYLSFMVGGHPSVDEIIQYFEDRDYLAKLVPLLSSNRHSAI